MERKAGMPSDSRRVPRLWKKTRQERPLHPKLEKKRRQEKPLYLRSSKRMRLARPLHPRLEKRTVDRRKENARSHRVQSAADLQF